MSMSVISRFTAVAFRVSRQLIVPSLQRFRLSPGIAVSVAVNTNTMQNRGQSNEKGDEGYTKRPTRSDVRDKEKSDKEYYLQMNLKDKRKLYKCGSKFKGLKDIQTWKEFYSENRARLTKDQRKKKCKPFYPVDDQINQKVSIWKGDLTTLEIDAIVNAANNSLLGGGGVDGAIHHAAGKKLLGECSRLGGCPTGEARITGGYKLPARYVIHTVGPIGENEPKLKSAYQNSLNCLLKNELRSVAFPCISTGIYGYDNKKACNVALGIIREFMKKNAESIDRIIFCLFLPKDVELYEENMQIYFPVEILETNNLKESSVRSKEGATAGSGQEDDADRKDEEKETRSRKKSRTITDFFSSKEKRKPADGSAFPAESSKTESKAGTSSTDVEMKESVQAKESELPCKGGSTESKSPSRSSSKDTKSPSRGGTTDSEKKSRFAESKSPRRSDSKDSKSPSRGGPADLMSPTRDSTTEFKSSSRGDDVEMRTDDEVVDKRTEDTEKNDTIPFADDENSEKDGDTEDSIQMSKI